MADYRAPEVYEQFIRNTFIWHMAEQSAINRFVVGSIPTLLIKLTTGVNLAVSGRKSA